MANETRPTDIYLGKRDAVIAEIGGLAHIYEGKYLLQAYGDANWDAVGVDTIKDLKIALREWKAAYPEARVCWL